MFTDTHCHFDDSIDEFKQYLNNSLDQNVNRFILSGYSIDTNAHVIDISKKYKEVYVSIGYHPDQAMIINDFDIDILKSQLNFDKVVAIGEIGLDYHYDGYDREKQIALFEKQLMLAQEFDLPVVIHSRDATNDTIEILKKYKVRGVIHSFSGSLETANIYIKLGFKLGINGVVTFKNCNLKDTLSKISPKNIVLETDSPYLTPVPFRGQINESKNIKIIADYLCVIYNVSFDKLAEITNRNISDIFDI